MNDRKNARAVVAIALVALGLVVVGLPAQAKPAKSRPPTAPATPPEIPELPQPIAQPVPPMPAGPIPAPVQAGDEIVGLRTERSKTFAADRFGEYTTELYSERVHFQDAATGGYKKIDAELAPSKDGKRASKANSFVLELADDADAEAVAKVRLDDDHSLAFALEGASDSKATTDKNASTYAGATDGVELRLTSRPDGLKEELVLASAAAGDRFVFPLELKGLDASINDNGDVVYRDEAGVERARTPHGFMTDSAVDPNSGDSPMSTGVAYALVPHGKGTALEVTLTDKDWLNHPARSWPVIVDPQIAVASFADDTFVTSGFHWDNSHDLELRAGTYDGGAHVTRSFMKFNTGAINGKTVNWAQLHIAERHSWNCSSGWPTVHRVTGGWNGATMQDWPGAGFDANPAGGLISANGACHGRTVVYDVTSAAAHWSANPTQSYGLALNASATDNNAYKKFASSETGAPPALHVNWTDPPPLPSGNAFGYLDGVYPIVGGVSLNGWAMDPDAATAPIDVHVYRDANIFVEALRANTSRPDVGAAYPGYGNNHGFVGYAPMAPGSHYVCAYAVNVGGGSAVTPIGCRTVVVPSRTANEPLGALDSVTPSPGGATTKGWALDPDTVAASTVHVYADLEYVGPLTANTSRPDIGAAYPGYGNNHGYESFLAMTPGFHNVCVFAINSMSGTSHRSSAAAR